MPSIKKGVVAKKREKRKGEHISGGEGKIGEPRGSHASKRWTGKKGADHLHM